MVPEDPSRLEIFAGYYESSAASLHAWAALRCRGPLGMRIEAEDLVQDVVLEAFRAIERFDPERGPFRPWLFGLATRVASGLLRRSARRHGLTAMEAIDGGLAQEPPAELTTISRRARRSEVHQELLAAIDGLDPLERDLFLYRGIEGLEHAAVAELLGLSTEAATKRWQRLRERLAQLPAARDLLGEY